MQKFMIAAAMSVGTFLGSMALADAMPLSNVSGAAAPEVTLVAGGCGPGFHRGPYGGCRPNGFGGPGWRGPGWRGPGWRGPGWRGPGWRY